MIIREIFAMYVSSDPERAVEQVNEFLRNHPNYGLVSYEVTPGSRAVFGRYDEPGEPAQPPVSPSRSNGPMTRTDRVA